MTQKAKNLQGLISLAAMALLVLLMLLVWQLTGTAQAAPLEGAHQPTAASQTLEG